MADDRELDRMLEEEMTSAPPEEELLKEVTPWKKALRRIVWGIGLTTVTLHLLNLDLLLPAVGKVLLLLGARTLRRENRWFTAFWGIAVARLLWCWADLVGRATVWWVERDWTAAVWLWFGAVLVQYLCLWRGIKEVRRAAGQEPKAGAAGALVWLYAVMFALGLLQARGLLVLPVLVADFCVLCSLSRVSRLLDGAGYVVEAAPVRCPDRRLWAALALSLAVCIPLAGLLWGHYSMDWTARDVEEQAGLEEVRADLLALGLPGYVLDDLAPEDLAALEGAVRVELDVYEEPFGNARGVVTVQEGRRMTHTVYERELQMTSIAVELPGQRWRIIQHFLWQGDPPDWEGTEYLKLLPSYRWRDTYSPQGEPSGRVLCDRDGTTYIAPYDFLGELDSPAALWATFSLPADGAYCRGYVTYSFETLYDKSVMDDRISYAHQMWWLNYPLMTARQYDIAGFRREMGCFETVEFNLVFYPHRTGNSHPEDTDGAGESLS